MAAAAASLVLLAFGGAAAIAVVTVEDDPPVTPTVVTETVTQTTTVDRLAGGHTAKHWRRLNNRARAEMRRLRRLLHQSPSVKEAINLACATYGHCDELWRKAFCESRLNPRATNGEADGLFQFLASTWRTTPYSGFSVWSPYANALAAGWMHRQGRGTEWVCR